MSTIVAKSVSAPEVALFAATRGIIGLGAGLLLASKLERKQRKTLGWTLFVSGLASTIPIAVRLFHKKQADAVEQAV